MIFAIIMAAFVILCLSILIYFLTKEIKRLNKIKIESIKSLEIIRSYTEDSMPNNTQLIVKSLCNREIERLKILHKTS